MIVKYDFSTFLPVRIMERILLRIIWKHMKIVHILFVIDTSD